MAYRNKQIHNPKTGQGITFLHTARDTNGKLLEMEASFVAGSVEPPSHYHPRQMEDFAVLKGHLTVRVNGHVKVYHAGDTLHLPVRTVHAMWNASEEPTLVNWQVRPALRTEYLLETGTGLARDGKTNEAGMPDILQTALMMNKFSDVFRLAKPPFIVQRIVFTILAPVSWLCGKRATYKQYLD
jgi:quercetin dioxygenase-like cupin family protein